MAEQETSVNKSKMYSDAPIEDAKSFNFEAYSKVISEIILNKENKTPFSIAINGKWGRGKTTLMRTIREELKRESGEGNNRKVKSVWFDAWKYPETDSMLAALVFEIFEEMASEKGLIDKLKVKMVGDKQINILKAVSDIARTLTVSQVEFDKWLEDPAYKGKLSFYDLFQGYMKEILTTFVLEKEEGEYSDKEGVLVIFIDDLDRCPPKQITKVLESINLFFDQEGCFFVFGADLPMVSKAIDFDYEKLEGFSGIDYIKKMIQLQFDLPEIGEGDITNFIEKELKIEDQLIQYFDLIIIGLESNQREIKRFLNSLNLMRMLGESIFKENYVEELLIKWSILNFASPDFIKQINEEPEISSIIIKMEEISGMEKDRIEKHIESLDESDKELINNFKQNEKIFEKILSVLRFGDNKFIDSDINTYLFLSRVASQEPGRIIEPGTDDGLYDLLTNRDIYKNRKGGEKFKEISESEQQEFINLFLSNLEKGDEPERNDAAYVLKKRYMRDKIAVNVLIRKLEEKNAFVKKTVVEILGLKGELEALIEAKVLEDNDPTVRTAAVEVLGKIGGKRAIYKLIEKLEDNDLTVRKAAVEALGKMEDKRAIRPLLKKLEETDPSILIATLDSIARIGASDWYILSAVDQLTGHENNDVNTAAKKTYETLR